MTGRARDNTFFAKHRPVIRLIVLLLAIYTAVSAWHYFRTYDYTDEAVAAYESALDDGQDVGFLTVARNETLIDNRSPIHSTLEQIAKPGNAKFAPVFDRAIADNETVADESKSRAGEGECFLFPVVARKGDPIDRIVGFTEFCFDSRDKEKYAAISVPITNR